MFYDNDISSIAIMDVESTKDTHFISILELVHFVVGTGSGRGADPAHPPPSPTGRSAAAEGGSHPPEEQKKTARLPPRSNNIKLALCISTKLEYGANSSKILHNFIVI